MIQAKVLLGLVYILLLVACATTPAVVAAPETAPPAETTEAPAVDPAPVVLHDSIQATRDGFSPLASTPANELAFELGWAVSSASSSWAVSFSTDGGPAVRTIQGTGSVPSLKWDGRDDAGKLVPQDRYHATLSLSENGTMVEKASSMFFVVDIVPPTGSIAANPEAFRLGGDAVTLNVNITAGGAPWTIWRLAVLHPDGRRFRDFISEENRSDKIVWDGRAVNNALLEAGTTYRLEAEVFDVYGNRGVLVGGLSVLPATVVAEPASKPLQVSVVLDGTALAALPVWFGPNTADLDGVDADRQATNQSSLEQLANLLKSAQRPVVIVGHANQVLYEVPAKAAYEQRETLIPLSIARAETVKAALVKLGLSTDALAVRGDGASDPLVPFDDAENRWKNRRVVIELRS